MDEVYLGSVNDYLTFSSLQKDPLPESSTGYRISADGFLTALYHNGDPMRFLAYIEFGRGWVRGNHYHRNKVENMVVLKGELKAKYYLVGQPEMVLNAQLGVGDTVAILPGCVHIYEAEEFAVALEFSPRLYDSDDVFRPTRLT